MTDPTDRASDEEEAFRAEALRRARLPLPPGKAGECDFCGEHSQRLLDGACPPCTDRYRLALR